MPNELPDLSARNALRDPIAWPVDDFERDLIELDVLAKAKARLPLALLRQGLDDGRVAVRVNSLVALALYRPLDRDWVDRVLVMLRDGSPSVQRAAVQALSGAAPASLVIPALLRAQLADPRAESEIAEIMKGYGAESIPVLIDALRCDGSDADRAVLPYLLRLGPPAQAALGKALAHSDPRVRANAIAGLSLLGASALQDHQYLLTLLGRDAHVPVRTLARQALTLISRATSPRFVEVRPLPIEAMDRQLADDAALKKAARQLETAALIALSRDGRELVRANAWRSLASLGPLDPAGAALAAVAVKDSDAQVRREACLALRQCPEVALDAAAPPLLLATRDGDRAVQQAARQALLSQGKRAIGLSIEFLGHAQPALQDAAIAMLVQLEQDAAPALFKALSSPAPVVRENAIVALADVGGKGLESAADALQTLTADIGDGVRVQAFRAIVRLSIATLKARRGALLDIARRGWREDAVLAVRNAAQVLLARLSNLPP